MAPVRTGEVDSTYAWMRLGVSVLICMIGGVGMWSAIVAIPAVQAEFGIARSAATLAYTFAMIGFTGGGILMGMLADRKGVTVPLFAGTVSLSLGYVLAGYATSMWQFALIHGVLIGFLGSSATFGPVIADISLWFARRRGIAVAIAACGSYLAGTVWPPIMQHFIETVGWRTTHIGIGIFCIATLLPLSLVLRRPSPGAGRPSAAAVAAAAVARTTSFGISPFALQVLLMLAGIACCVAMSMPQVHLVAYCADLGYGAVQGANMMALQMACGIVSRLVSGVLSDRIGPLPTLLIGSAGQGLSLLLFLPFDGLVSLYAISAIFGLSQGGIVPAYAMIIREQYPPHEAGMRVGMVLSATLAGMALGGWMNGAIFDVTGSYQAAFINGVLWNVLNLSIVLFLILRMPSRLMRA